MLHQALNGKDAGSSTLCFLILIALGAISATAQAASAGVINNLVVNDTANAADWSIQYSLTTGDRSFGDRSTTWSAINDSYYGWQFIRAAADSAIYTGSTLASFSTLTKAQIEIAWDTRSAAPAWLLANWSDTGFDLLSSDNITFRVYKRDVNAGVTINLGPAAGASMYGIIVKDTSPIGFASLNALGQNGTTGGAGGATVTASTLADLVRYATSTDPLIIRIQGTIDMSPNGWGYKVPVKSNKTILGLGTNATLRIGGLQVSDNEKNVIIRNLTIQDSFQSWDGKLGDWDAITVQNGAHHVWIDRCTLTHMEDGLVDIVKGADYVTVSNVKFINHNKTFAIGTDGYDNHPKVTAYHNYFAGTNQRNPLSNNSLTHVLNNYYEGITSYGANSRREADVYVEANYYRSSANITDISDGNEGDIVFTSDNVKDNVTGRNETRGAAFTPSSYYTYFKDSASTLPANVVKMAGAGKIRK